MPHHRFDWNAEIRRRYGREYGERLPKERVSEILRAAHLERTSVSARYAGGDSARSLELLFDDLRSIEEDYERAFVVPHSRQPAADADPTGASPWITCVAPPPRWAARTRMIMKRYRPLQSAMLDACGRHGFVGRAELPVVLNDVLARDRAEGEIVTLELPPKLADSYVVGRLGVHMNPLILAVRYSAEREAAQHPDGFPPFDVWLAGQQHDLSRQLTCIGKLSLVVEHIAKETGCAEWQALAYVLCGELPELPWVRARRVTRPATGEAWLIEVAAPNVPAGDVLGTYLEASASSTEPRRSPAEAPSAAQVHLYEFVVPLRARGVPWSEIREAWNSLPGVKTYARTRTMEVAYLRARKRIEAASSLGPLQGGEGRAGDERAGARRAGDERAGAPGV